MNRRRFVQSTLAAAVAGSLAGRYSLAALLSPTGSVDADIDAVTGDGGETILPRAAVQELADGLRGNLLLPGHPAYEQARLVLNASIDKHPALVVQPMGVPDVQDAVNFARENDLLVAVKCGGHNVTGKSTCDGGLLIDLSTLRNVRVEPQKRMARVAGGSLLAEMDHDTMAFGLVTTAGTVSHTGVGGLTLGGGFGRVARRFGLAVDNVLGVNIVTADGRYLRADAEQNQELYWGLRGGGGNFGIATSFDFRLHPMQREVIGGMLVYPIKQARQVLKTWAQVSAGAPDEMYLDAGLAAMPAQGTAAWIHVCYSGPHDQADRLLAPLRSAGTLLEDSVGPNDYVAIQRSGDISDPRANGSYLKSGFVTHVSDALVDDIVAGFEADPARSLIVAWQHAGGAIGRVASDATAFAHRHVGYDTLMLMDWPVDTDPTEQIRWLRAYWDTIEPHTRGIYSNDLVDESQQRVHRNYGGNFDRLLALKKQYDPGNLFRLNANIDPAA